MCTNLRNWLIVKRSGFFDIRYYLVNNPDVRRADIPALNHFMKQGWIDGRNPSTLFDTRYYLETNPDVKRSGANPLVHFLTIGRKEGRLPKRPE